MAKRSLLHLCWCQGLRGGGLALGEGLQSEEGEVEGDGHHQGEAGLHQGEDLVAEEGGLHLQEDDLLLEGDLHPQGGEADLEEDPDHQLDAQEDPLPGLLEAGLAVQQGAEDTRHQAALIPRVKNYQKLFQSHLFICL